MPLSFQDQLFMYMRRTPVKAIKTALKMSEDAELDIPVDKLEVHSLAGGDPVKVVEALIYSRNHQFPFSFDHLVAVDLGCEQDLMSVVKACAETHQLIFDTYSPNNPDDQIIGFCKDGTQIQATCTIDYTLPLFHIFGDNIENLQETLSAKLSIIINTTESYSLLRDRKKEHETILFEQTKEVFNTIKLIRLEYRCL